MQVKTIAGLAFITLMAASCQQKKEMEKKPYAWPANVQAPVCEKKPKELIAHGDTRLDPYYWLNDFFKKGPDSSNVVAYLEAENRYYDTMMAGTKTLQEDLFKEMKARIKEKDESVPYLKNGYYYYNRLVEGKDYFVFCRKKGSLDAPEEVLLDVNTLAEGHAYYSAAGFSISPDNNLMAYAVDTVSRRQYVIMVKNLQTGELYADRIQNTEGDPVWAADNKTLFYTAKNPVTLLSEKIKRHKLGTDPSTDAVVYEEKDPSNYIGVGKSKSDKYIFITSQATLSSEIRMIDASTPEAAFTVFQPRMKEVLYNVDHAGSLFYIRTNLNAKNFKIATCPENATASNNWTDIVPHKDDVLVQDIDLF